MRTTKRANLFKGCAPALVLYFARALTVANKNLGFFLAMSSKRNAVLCGRRTPCSQLCTAFGLTQRKCANAVWLACKDSRTLRISLGFMGFGGAAISITRKSTSSPRSYACASARNCPDRRKCWLPSSWSWPQLTSLKVLQVRDHLSKRFRWVSSKSSCSSSSWMCCVCSKYK